MADDAIKPRKGGPTPWVPDAEIIAQVEEMGGRGLSMEDIARNLGIHPATFYRKKKLYKDLREAVRRGIARTNLVVAGKLFEQVQAGNLIAMIYWSKARMGWREATAVELSGPDGGAIPFEIEAKRYENKIERVRQLIDAVNESDPSHRRFSQLRKLPIDDEPVETTSTELNSDDMPEFDGDDDDDDRG